MTKNYYIHGNTVRELEAPARQNRRTREEIEQAKRRKNRRNAARRNRQRADGNEPWIRGFLIRMCCNHCDICSCICKITVTGNIPHEQYCIFTE